MIMECILNEQEFTYSGIIFYVCSLLCSMVTDFPQNVLLHCDVTNFRKLQCGNPETLFSQVEVSPLVIILDCH